MGEYRVFILVAHGVKRMLHFMVEVMPREPWGVLVDMGTFTVKDMELKLLR